MDLLGHGHECFSESAWRACLRRAIEFGWEPEGTVAPTDWLGEWNGSYFSNDCQWVTDRDAGALGEALLRAIAALSVRANAQKPSPQELPDFLVEGDPLDAEIQLPDFFEEEDPLDAEIHCLRSLADYAAKGGFVIS